MIQPTDPFSEWINFWIAWWLIWGPRLPTIIGLVIFWLALIVVYGVLRRVLRRRARKTGVPPDAINGLILAMGLLFLYVAIIIFFYVIPEVYSYFIVALGTSSLIIGSALGLAIGQSVRNFVSGLYVIFSRPFHVEDYVRIGQIEGVVKEISMNYTKLLQPDGSDILVPNSVVLDSNVTNFMFEKEKLADLMKEIEKSDLKQRNILRKVSKAIDIKKIVRYAFPLSFHTSQDLRKLRASLNNVCTQWGKKFGFRPIYEISEVGQFSFTYIFILYTDKARKILEYKPKFIDEILNAVFLNSN